MPEAADWRMMMKRWKHYSLFLLLLVSGLVLTGAGAAGEHTIYADYSRQNGWMTPAVSLVFQGLKDGTGPWQLLFGAAQTSAEPGDSDKTPEAGTEPESGTADETGESISGNQISGNAVSGNGVPADAAPGSGTAENNVSGNSISGNVLSGNSISEENVSQNGGTSEEGSSAPDGQQEGTAGFPDPAFTASDGKQYDQFGQLIEPGQTEQGTDQAQPEIPEIRPDENSQSGQENGQQDSGAGGQEDAQQSSGQTGQETGDGADRTEGAQSGTGQETGTFVPVQESYFDDALFIGDSRTVGLDEYGGFQENTIFFAKTSLTIYDLFEEPEKFASLADGTKATLEEALTERKFGKIYIMLGINELGRGTTESFFTTYAEAVNRIRMLQPDALIFIQGIMRVGEEKNNTDRIFNNTNINERNQAISLMADDRNIYYLEVNDAVCDENGNLISDYTFDQIHLKAKYYQLWKDYLFAHGILKN